MDKIKDALQAMIDQAESTTDLPPQDILEKAADISATVTFGIAPFVVKALKTFELALKEEELKMTWQDQLQDRWGANAPDLDTFI